MDTEYILDRFVQVKLGEPYRLFPFGTIYKAGRKIEFTRELAEKCKLPHYKPAIKLGSHDERTPAGGSIVGLEVRDDGLYAVPEFTEKGMQSLTDGDYRYHSPEVSWKYGIEDPATGKIIEPPLIVGDAFLHNPHLGEAAAFYQTEQVLMEGNMSDENISVPKGIWDKFTAWLDRMTAEPEVTEEIVIPKVEESEEYKAAVSERDDFKAKFEQLQAEQAKQEAHTALVTELQDKEKFGSMYIEMAKAEEAATFLAGMNIEQRDWVMRTFSALTAQIDESALTGEKGSTGKGPDADPMKALNAAIEAKMTEKKVLYPDAYAMVRAEQPDLFKAVYGGK